MSYELANLFLSGVSALTSVCQAAMDISDRTKMLKKADFRLATPLQRGGKSVAVIDGKLLKEYDKKIRKAVSQQILTLRAEPDTATCAKVAEEAQQSVCFYLNEIKRHNAGHLSTKQLQDWWASYRCNDLYCVRDSDVT
ncbi:hypothetical protein [Aeromonas jandaei]|uniref:hypothetical protein n=1 Tax=Aeromonas jandaei TaxID=650 RepID=UPI001C05BB7C|nr:hypothetical protein [Aeromonas jandaei]QWL66120.1 hypothetical protein HQ398_07890 [Aeromonas jandaei]